MPIRIAPYKMSSNSAKKLQEAISELVGKRILRSSRSVFNKNTAVISWGTNEVIGAGKFVNSQYHVNNATNKAVALRIMEDGKVPIPEYTLNKQKAASWFEENKKVCVYCRTKLKAHEGDGIVIAKSKEELVDAPLYTKRFINGREYRVHIAFGDIIQIIQKKKRNGSNANPLIRSNKNWVFARNLNDPVPECVREVALKAHKSLMLDFAAYDVVYSVGSDKACVLEANTAPGLDNISARIYAETFAKQLKDWV